MTAKPRPKPRREPAGPPPTYNVMLEQNGKSAPIGAAWLNENGKISISVNPHLEKLTIIGGSKIVLWPIRPGNPDEAPVQMQVAEAVSAGMLVPPRRATLTVEDEVKLKESLASTVREPLRSLPGPFVLPELRRPPPLVAMPTVLGDMFAIPLGVHEAVVLGVEYRIRGEPSGVEIGVRIPAPADPKAFGTFRMRFNDRIEYAGYTPRIGDQVDLIVSKPGEKHLLSRVPYEETPDANE